MDLILANLLSIFLILLSSFPGIVFIVFGLISIKRKSITIRPNFAFPLETFQGDKAVFYGLLVIGWGIVLIVFINIWFFIILK